MKFQTKVVVCVIAVLALSVVAYWAFVAREQPNPEGDSDAFLARDPYEHPETEWEGQDIRVGQSKVTLGYWHLREGEAGDPNQPMSATLKVTDPKGRVSDLSAKLDKEGPRKWLVSGSIVYFVAGYWYPGGGDGELGCFTGKLFRLNVETKGVARVELKGLDSDPILMKLASKGLVLVEGRPEIEIFDPVTLARRGYFQLNLRRFKHWDPETYVDRAVMLDDKVKLVGGVNFSEGQLDEMRRFPYSGSWSAVFDLDRGRLIRFYAPKAKKA